MPFRPHDTHRRWLRLTRRDRRWAQVSAATQTLRIAARRLAHAPVYALTVTVLLAVGIGANAAVGTVVDRMFLRKLPVPDPDRVFQVYGGDTRDGRAYRVSGLVPFPLTRDLQPHLSGVDGLAAYSMAWVELGGTLAGSEAYAAFVTGNYFTLLGARPVIGRWIVPGEDAAEGSHPVAVISSTLWTRALGRDPGVVGRTIAIGRGTFTIVGVMPQEFNGVLPEGRTDIWLPYTMQAAATGGVSTLGDRTERRAGLVGRLAADGSISRVQAQVASALPALIRAYPESYGTLRLRAAIHNRLFMTDQNPGALPVFLLLVVMVALVHLAACSNVASLVLARLSARRRELGVRLCLGASRRRIVLESLAEPALLALAGAAGGLAIARVLTTRIASMQFMSAADPGLDARAAGIVALVTIISALAFGLAPSLDAGRRDPVAIIRGGPGPTERARREWNAPFMVGVQIAASAILLTDATALVRMFSAEAGVDPGFAATQTVFADVHWRTGVPLPADWGPITDQLVTRAAALPGVDAVVLAEGAPLYRPTHQEVVLVPGYTYGPDEGRRLSVQLVGPGYFAAIGARVASGREFGVADAPAGGLVNAVVVNEVFANRYLRGRDPIGAELLYKGDQRATVIGVVRALHDVSLTTPIPRVYAPLAASHPLVRFDVIARTHGDPRVALSSLNRAIVVSTLPVDLPSVRPMTAVLDDALATSRIGGISLGTCAAIALLLTALGLNGLVSTWAASRRAEIGIRIALGARGADVHALLLGRIAKVFAVGAGVGIILGMLLVRAQQGAWGPLIRVDGIPVVGSLAILGVVAGVAVWVPSRRAAKGNPVEALRAS